MDFDELTSWVFSKLGKEKQLHEYTDIIHKLIGVVIDFITANGQSLRLSQGRRFNPFCTKVRNQEKGYAQCHLCDLNNAQQAMISRKPLIYQCHMGLTELLVPLFSSGGRYIGSLTSGQFRLEGSDSPSPEQVRVKAQELGLDPTEMLLLAEKSPILTRTQLDGLIAYLQTIGNLIVSTHHNLLFMESVNAPNRIEQIKKYIEENYRKNLTLKKIAQTFYLSPGYISRIFRRETGVGFNAYLNVYRISRAREMLDETELNISEIAFLTGFNSISQFNRTFQSICRCSPRQYRNLEHP